MEEAVKAGLEIHHTRDCFRIEGTVEVGEGPKQIEGVGRGLPAKFGGQAMLVEAEQHEIVPAGKKPVGDGRELGRR
jgi:hypothetical protein